MWSKAALFGWLGILVTLVGYELWCVLSGDKATPPLTDAVVRYIPWYVTVPFLIWLLLHFVIRYTKVSPMTFFNG